MMVSLTMPELVGAAIGLALGVAHMFLLRRVFAPIAASYETGSKPVPAYFRLMPFAFVVVDTALGAYLAFTIYGGQ